MPHHYTFAENMSTYSIRCAKVHENSSVSNASITIRFVPAR